MAQQRHPEYFATEVNLVALCERVQVMVVDSSAALLATLQGLEDTILDSGAKVILLDSAASLLRKVRTTRLNETCRTESCRNEM